MLFKIKTSTSSKKNKKRRSTRGQKDFEGHTATLAGLGSTRLSWI